MLWSLLSHPMDYSVSPENNITCRCLLAGEGNSTELPTEQVIEVTTNLSGDVLYPLKIINILHHWTCLFLDFLLTFCHLNSLLKQEYAEQARNITHQEVMHVFRGVSKRFCV